MLPRLQAEEQLTAVRTGALGAGTYPEKDRERLLAALDDQAAGTKPARALKAQPADLAAMGIGGVVVPAAQNALSEPSEKGLSDV